MQKKNCQWRCRVAHFLGYVWQQIGSIMLRELHFQRWQTLITLIWKWWVLYQIPCQLGCNIAQIRFEILIASLDDCSLKFRCPYQILAAVGACSFQTLQGLCRAVLTFRHAKCWKGIWQNISTNRINIYSQLFVTQDT